MDILFDLLLMLGGFSAVYGLLGLLAGIAEKTDLLRCWIRRVLVEGG